jgi:hypothetical protein
MKGARAKFYHIIICALYTTAANANVSCFQISKNIHLWAAANCYIKVHTNKHDA